jgi:hypothetical protein
MQFRFPPLLRLYSQKLDFTDITLVVLTFIVLGTFVYILPDNPVDFPCLIESGRAANNGLSPYWITKSHIYGPNLNPPISIPFLAAAASKELSLPLWRIVSAIIYLGVIISLIYYEKINFSPVLFCWLLLPAGLWQVIGLGQIQAPLLVITASALIFLQRKRFLLAGICMGALVAIKPNFILWPALLFLSGQIIAPIASAITFIVISLVPIILYGPQIYLDWLGVHQAYFLPNRIGLGINTSIIGFATRHGLDLWGYIGVIILLLFIIWWSWKKRPDVRTVSGIALAASLLASPIAWIAYTVLLVPLFIKKHWSHLETIAAFLLIMPEPMVWIYPNTGIIYLFALILLITNFILVTDSQSPFAIYNPLQKG